MSWRDAFFRQARSDNEIRKLLNKERVEYAHQLHYLQMTTEKLAKGLLTKSTSTTPPKFVHKALVTCLRMIKGRPDIQRILGYKKRSHYMKSIDSILSIANHIEELAPSYAGKDKPNPEYPWESKNDKTVYAPVDFDFSELNPQDPKLRLLVSLVDKLLETIS